MMLATALACTARGWHVFPCNGKIPIEEGGYKTASTNETKVRDWWTRYPNANIAIAPGPSGITVLDLDTGLTDENSLRAFCAAHGIPETLAVRTGKRPQYRVQLYFSGNTSSLNGWQEGGFAGDLRGAWGHVMAAGSVHPESGERYEVLWDRPLAPVSEWVQALTAAPRKDMDGNPLPPRTLDDGPISEWRNDAMIRILGKKRSEGANDDELREYAVQVNESRMVPPLDEDELERLIRNACKFPIGERAPEVILSGSKPVLEPPKDWKTRYHTFDEINEAPPISFLIRGFLAVGSITALAAPVGQRKSLIALNVAHALCTGEPLFKQFTVDRKPARVVYLCPEMGISSFSDRLKKIGLMPHVGKSLFCRTMSASGLVDLDELGEELDGAVVIIDTAVRYLRGDENSSEDMRVFAESVFRLMRCGALGVLLLHHSAKGTKESLELTLENAMRGSGELGAFVSCCWATRLQDPMDPYKSASYISNVKQRDFESKPFEVTSGPDCRLHIVTKPGEAVLSRRQPGAKSNRDGLEDAALTLIRGNPEASVRTLVCMLADAGIKRSLAWVSGKRSEINGTGVTLSVHSL
jgi:hypothetical protein